MGELIVGLSKCFAFYNGERPHQLLGPQKQEQQQNQKQNRVSAVQLREKLNVQLKLSVFLSWLSATVHYAVLKKLLLLMQWKISETVRLRAT